MQEKPHGNFLIAVIKSMLKKTGKSMPKGLKIFVESTLPIGTGLGSSIALLLAFTLMTN
jgi:galactokinase